MPLAKKAKRLLFLSLFLSYFTLSGQPETGHFPEFLKKQLPRYSQLFENKLKYRLQIIYIRIDRDKDNVPHFTQFSFNNNPELFFYCASTVKLPASMLALEKIEKLNIPGLNRKNTMITDSVFYCEHHFARDT